MTFNQLKKRSPSLATLFKACGYTEQEAEETLKNWRIVKVDDGVRVDEVPPAADAEPKAKGN